jgi:hypothetical protein
MTGLTDSLTNIAVLAGIAIVGYVAYTKGLFSDLLKGPEESVCDEYTGLPFYLCKLGVFAVGGNEKPDPVLPAYTLDSHGCRSDIQHWCWSEGMCKDIAQACRTITDPGTCKPWQHVVNNYCMDDPAKMALSCRSDQYWDPIYGCVVRALPEPDVPQPDPTRCELLDHSGWFSLGDVRYNPNYAGLTCMSAMRELCERFGGHDPRYCSTW